MDDHVDPNVFDDDERFAIEPPLGALKTRYYCAAKRTIRTMSTCPIPPMRP